MAYLSGCRYNLNLCVEIIAVDCKERAKSSSPPQDLSLDQYHKPTEKDVVLGKGRFIQNLAGMSEEENSSSHTVINAKSSDCPQDNTSMALWLVVDINESDA